MSVTITSTTPIRLLFFTLGRNPTNPWPSGPTLCSGRINNSQSYFFRYVPALGAANRVDYMCIASIQIVFCVVIRAIIIRINSTVVTYGHCMRARNLIDLKSSASTCPFAHIDNPYLGSIVGDGVLKLISWLRL